MKIFSYILFSLILASCTKKKEWTGAEKLKVVQAFTNIGMQGKEIPCVVNMITALYSYDEYLKNGDNYIAGKGDPDYVKKMSEVDQKCSLKSYSEDFKKKYVLTLKHLRQIPESVGACVYEKIKEKYSFDDFYKNDKDSLSPNPNLEYLSYISAAQKNCE
jgi:hypothetical protein